MAFPPVSFPIPPLIRRSDRAQALQGITRISGNQLASVSNPRLRDSATTGSWIAETTPSARAAFSSDTSYQSPGCLVSTTHCVSSARSG